MTARSLPNPALAGAFLLAVAEWKRGLSAPAPVVMHSAIAAPAAPTNVSTLDERLAMACGIGGAREVAFTSNSVARTP